MRFQRQTISVEEAVGRLLTDLGRLEEEQVDIYESYGRILARDITATSDLPPFDRSPLDGFAVRAEDTAGATVEQPVPLQVVETIAAGDVPAKEVTPGTASRIMTGAMLPPGPMQSSCSSRQSSRVKCRGRSESSASLRRVKTSRARGRKCSRAAL